MTAMTVLLIVVLVLTAPTLLPLLLTLVNLVVAGVGAVLYTVREFIADCWWELRHGGEW